MFPAGFNGAINVLVKASRWSSGLSMLRDLAQLGIQASAVGCSTLLNVEKPLGESGNTMVGPLGFTGWNWLMFGLIYFI